MPRPVSKNDWKHVHEGHGSLFAQETTSTWRPPESLPELSRYDSLGVDCETTGTDWRGHHVPIGVSLAAPDGKKWYLPWGHKGGGNLDKRKVVNYLQRQLRDKGLYTSEGKFEVQMLRKVDVDLENQNNKLHEIQYRAGLLSDVRRSFKLNDMAHDELGKKKVDLDASRIWEMPSSEVGPYAEEDAALTLELGVHYDKQIDTEGLRQVCDLEDRLIFAVCEMERNGVPLDMDKLRFWQRKLKKQVQDQTMGIYQQLGIRVNANSSPDLVKLFQKIGLDYPRTEPTERFPEGQPSFPDSFLKTIDNEYVKTIRMIRSLNSIDSKFISSYEKRQLNGILYYKLHQLKVAEEEHGLYGAISGRFSSSSINIQQVFKPSRQAKKFGFDDYLIRELFIPRKGRLWVEADAAQIEFRLFAHYSKSKRLIEQYALNPEIDFHEVVQQMVSIIRIINRDEAKNINFAKLYGAGLDKLAWMLGCSRDQAQELVDVYNRAFPEASKLMYQAMEIAQERGFVKTLSGRIARFPNGERLHSALNRVIQGSAADIMKEKLIEVYDNRKYLDLFMFFTVHDAVDGDTGSEAKAWELKELLDAPIAKFNLRVPIIWDVAVGENWANQRKLKKAA